MVKEFEAKALDEGVERLPNLRDAGNVEEAVRAPERVVAGARGRD